jgi:hypothetical protein
MRVAVVTPYFKEAPETLARCIGSVQAQRSDLHNFEVVHLLVADGHPQDWLDGEGVRHLRLDRSHADYGNTPRSIGGVLAASEGFDAIAFLDADNWYEADHVQTCLDTVYRAAEPVDYVVARRRIVRQDGSVMPIVASDDASFVHVDTSCYLLLWGAFHTLGLWGTMPKALALVGDRVYRQALAGAGLRFAAAGHATVNYLCTWESFFRAIGEPVPDYAKPNIDVGPTIAWMNRLDPRSRRIVERLAGCRIEFA